MYICISIYIYICMYICVCARIYIYIYMYITKLCPFKFPDKCFDFRLKLVDEFTKIVPGTFKPFIGHHQRLLACIKSVLKSF